MTKREPNLTEHLNSRGQPVISVAGYGKMRPVADNTTLEGQATNRRIDLRLIMYTPRSVEDIDRIREESSNGGTRRMKMSERLFKQASLDVPAVASLNALISAAGRVRTRWPIDLPRPS